MITVNYYDTVLRAVRYRTFTDIKDALSFIENRATMPHLYNHFNLKIEVEDEQ
jgi:hypothetical protein